ncbi:helix-turn-helix domain-containing protein [Promicromonospora kroppenstedtii]|uniref:Helix-turn-helix domain-containing protein n=1 Tax=Promicromonospora kroppenstedtii TaxID=440482 RepID=A0ABW7XMI5_9MICO
MTPTAEHVADRLLLADVVSEAPVPLWVIGPEGSVVVANRAAVSFLGYRNELDLVGGPSHELLHRNRPDGTSYPPEDCPIICARGMEHQGQEWFMTRAGDPRPVHWSTRRLHDTGATVLSFTPTASDAVRHRAERRLRDAVPTSAPLRSRAALRDGLYAIIHERFADPLFSVADLATEAHVSVRSLQALFADVGRSPASEVRRIRLDFAHSMLERGHAVQTACQRSGFLDPGSFGRAFRRRFGYPPSQVRPLEASG